MIFNAFKSAMTTRNSIEKKANTRACKSKYITEKYNERSITNRYFK